MWPRSLDLARLQNPETVVPNCPDAFRKTWPCAYLPSLPSCTLTAGSGLDFSLGSGQLGPTPKGAVPVRAGIVACA